MVLDQNSIISFLFEKGMIGKVPVNGNCVDSGPSLVAETLSGLPRLHLAVLTTRNEI